MESADTVDFIKLFIDNKCMCLLKRDDY